MKLDTRISQMELTLAGARKYRAYGRPQKRSSRARWWFNRMRDVVEQAMDRQAAPSPRSQQIFLASLEGKS